MLGEFNARVGADYKSWSRSIGHFGIGKLYENGQRLLELCSYHDLCITNTFFSTKLNHRVSWRHPRSHHWHQLDLVITEDPCWTVSSSLVVITVLTVTPTPPWSAAKYAFNQNELTAQSRKYVPVSRPPEISHFILKWRSISRFTWNQG